MQAGRKLDKQVAVRLGWEVDEHIDIYLNNGAWREIPHFSTEWEGMGVLVEEARNKGIYIDILPNETCYICEAKTISNAVIGQATKSEAPHAACLTFLEAKEKRGIVQ